MGIYLEIQRIEIRYIPESVTILTIGYDLFTQNIWGRSWDNDIASLRVFMTTLRKKIEPEPGAPKYIQTHIGIGYRMLKVDQDEE